MPPKTHSLNSATNRRISGNIRRLLRKHGWTVEKFAIEADYDKSNLYSLLGGKLNYTIKTLDQFAATLKVDISILFRK